jgi:surface antigen
MKLKIKKIHALLVSLFVTISTLSYGVIESNLVEAASSCQCTEYVNAVKSLGGGYPDAKDWNDGYLAGKNYVETSDPQAGDIVVMETGYSGANDTYGHVAVLVSIDANGYITARGANQGGSDTEGDCNNVNTIGFVEKAHPNDNVSFWRSSSTWNVTSNTDVTSNKTVTGDVIVSNGATLHVKNGATLNIDLVNHKLLVSADSKVLIDADSKIE